MTLSDEQLMERVQRGDDEAAGELLERWRARLYAFLSRRAGPHDAEDLFQETWLRVIRARASYDPRRRFSTWLFQIANNLCRDRGRRRAVREAHAASVRDDQRHAAAPAAPALDLRIDMHRRIAALPERLREVLLLRYYHRLSEREIADVLDIPPGTVKSRLHHAVRALRAPFGAEEAESA